jgi:NitT/TauT family transport system permease protein
MKRSLLLPPLVLFVTVLAVWESVCWLGWVAPYVLAPPSQVATSLFVDAGELFPAFGWTALSAFLGFSASAVLGVAASVALFSSRWTLRAFYPFAVVFQTVPIIAVAPLLGIWFGYGVPTAVVAAFLASVFPVLMATLTGLQSADPRLRDLFQLYGASWGATLLKLVLPMALPSLLTGLRIAAGLAVIGAIVGEFIGGSGLGSVVDVARTQQRVDKVFASVFLASVMGALAIALIDVLNRVALGRWNPRPRVAR